MATFVTRLFVGSGTNAGTYPATVNSGDIIFTDASGVRITTAAQAAAAAALKIVAGVGGYTVQTPLIARADIQRFQPGGFTEQAYQAPVQQVDTIDFSNFAAGDQVSIRVEYKVNRKLQQGRDSVSNFNHTFAAGSTLGVELQKIADKINSTGIIGQAPAVASKYITASVAGNTLVLTGKNPPATGSVLDTPDFTAFRTFVTELTPQGSLGSGTAYPVTNTAVANPGQGTGAQVKEEEEYESGAYGRTDKTSYDRALSPLNVSTNQTYSYLRLSGFKAIEGDFNGLKHTPLRNSLALPVGSAQLTEAQTILRAFVSGVATTPPAGE